MADTFTYRDVEYSYYDSDSELAVVVPIMRAAIADAEGTVAEVGTAIGHRPAIRWMDMDTATADGSYDLLVSATGIQHVDGDLPEVIQALLARLSPGGRLLLAAPMGYRDDVDRMMNPAAMQGSVGFLAIRDNEWVEVDYREARQCPYRRPSRGARAVAIAEWRVAAADEPEDDGE